MDTRTAAKHSRPAVIARLESIVGALDPPLILMGWEEIADAALSWAEGHVVSLALRGD